MKQGRYSKAAYNDVAEVIASQRRGAASMTGEEMRLAIAVQFAVMFSTDNPRFDRVKFYDACKGEVKCYQRT